MTTGSSSPGGAPPHRPYFGAVDIGTNTVRLLVAEPAGAAPPHWIDRRAVVVRLGEGVDGTGRFSPQAMERTVAALADFGAILQRHPRIEVRAVATSATRDAANRREFLDRAEAALGVRPEVITGAEESELSFAGATAEIAAVGDGRPYLVVDPGGGSTEFVLGRRPSADEDKPGDGGIGHAVSVDIGSVRLTERRLPNLPASPAEVDGARRHVDELLRLAVTLPYPPGSVIGVAGTFTSLAAIHLELAEYDPAAVHGSRLTLADLGLLTERLRALSVGETAAIPSLDPARAPVLLGGAIVAERSLAHVGAASIMVSERDILDGIVMRLAGGAEPR